MQIQSSTGRRDNATVRSPLMYPIPLVPRFVTRLVASATIDARTKGETFSPGNHIDTVVVEALARVVLVLPGLRVQPAVSLPTNGTT